MDEVVLDDRQGGVAVVTLNRPHRLNAIDRAVMDAAFEICTRLGEDDTVRAVVLTGAGRGFCSGGDLKALDETAERRQQRAEGDVLASTRRGMRMVEVLRDMPKPVIAAINGACAGAGIAWACACDIRLAARSAFFVPAFVDAGLSGDYGITWTLPRIIGAGPAAELLLTGTRVSADEAAAIGLVARVVDDRALLPTALELARRFEQLPAGAVADLKANLRDAQALTFSETIDRESERLVRRLRQAH